MRGGGSGLPNFARADMLRCGRVVSARRRFMTWSPIGDHPGECSRFLPFTSCIPALTLTNIY